ncbi:MAG TPA: helix-turn-helix domain-containing protein [Actinomycetota bacterium]
MTAPRNDGDRGSKPARGGSERDFAEALAQVLGPLYRVSVVAPDGTEEATFGPVLFGRVVAAEIPLPRSGRRLVLGLDLTAVDAARRTAELLAIGWDDSERPAGAFTHVDQAMDELISLAEQSVGRSLAEMNRLEKQRVVRFLDERGAFALRKSVERVADALGVSRFTVYNYLDASRSVVTESPQKN